MENRFEEMYKTNNTPWDHDLPDSNLIDMVAQRPIPRCKALDVGCGTGDNAIWLAQKKFQATGCDLSKTAIERAKKKAALSNVNCSFMVADFLKDGIPGSPFDLVFDRGCLHCVDSAKERRRFAKNVAAHLDEDGLWLALAGNADGQVREVGPPTLSAKELVAAVEPYFEIISLAAGRFGSDQADPPKAWICLMQKRTGTL